MVKTDIACFGTARLMDSLQYHRKRSKKQVNAPLHGLIGEVCLCYLVLDLCPWHQMTSQKIQEKRYKEEEGGYKRLDRMQTKWHCTMAVIIREYEAYEAYES